MARLLTGPGDWEQRTPQGEDEKIWHEAEAELNERQEGARTDEAPAARIVDRSLR
jgi:hypothetical protein